MQNDQERKVAVLETAAPEEKSIGFWQDIKKNGFGNAAFGWGFALGFFVHAHLLGVGKPGLLWRLF